VALAVISLKAAAGLDLMKRIKERDGHVCILVWSMHIKSLDPECALRAGRWATSTWFSLILGANQLPRLQVIPLGGRGIVRYQGHVESGCAGAAKK
jgi:hypothetical protein